MNLALPVGLMLTVSACGSEPKAAVSNAELSRQDLPLVSEARVEEITEWMPAEPQVLYPRADDRAVWDRWYPTKEGQTVIERAQVAMGERPDILTQALYDDFKLTGDRQSFEKPFWKRLKNLQYLVMAEALENKGRFLPAIESYVSAINDEPAWIMPAHAGDRKLWEDNYDKIDLGASIRGWSLACTDWVLQDRLQPETRERIREEVNARVLEPYLEHINSGVTGDFWFLRASNNWNAVCNAGVLGMALILMEAPEDRARIAAAFELYTQRFIEGFGDDGFCQEGLGYWNFGFGFYLVGADLLKHATGGELDLLSTDKIRAISQFGRRWQISGNHYPAFSDARLTDKPAGWMLDYIAVNFGEGTISPVPNLKAGLNVSLLDVSLPRPEVPEKASASPLALRDWFPDGGALISRRHPDPNKGLAVAMKSGHNAQLHNHNDSGSYVIANNGHLAAGDLGRDAYVKDTFNENRYRSQAINSFGHPVPLVAGKQQSRGAQARAVSVQTDFSETSDMWEMELTSAYDVPALEELIRTYIFDRAGGGALEILDEVRFKEGSPEDFGTAIVVLPGYKFEILDEQSLRIRNAEDPSGKSDLLVRYEELGGQALVLNQKPVIGIVPNDPPRGTRLGIDLAEPAEEATLRLTFTPWPETIGETASLD
ncbi:heparinase II/III family protein [Ruficoccus sp. ZRK36]|uniref:heparinase II/III family protein n=1 Tax=Ruficoccus sp. ZRK36 TaxID=2866311 RepID=UPI001C73B193|nr:heparinase II/III family protein [Ruficoccus sp. ZRK36]QYY34507.1 heparinase II/III family protein [Ruficoccus sp. ZRK36]